MEVKIGESRLVLKQGDITKEEVDAIVNAANPSLLGGGGVDGAIHRAGGPAILEECKKLGGCQPGDAKVTTAGRLKAKYVIHTVGPIWYGGTRREPEILASAYRRSLEEASKRGCKTVAFPSISTGAYGYPMEKAAEIALKTVIDFVRQDEHFEKITFVLFGEKAFQNYRETLKKLV